MARELLLMHDVPVDALTFFACLWNFSAVGTLLVFWTEYGLGHTPPLQLQQAYLVVISALLAWSATKTPEWSTWGLLGAVAVWDLIAVLTPRGPLKMLVEEAEKRDEPIPGDEPVTAGYRTATRSSGRTSSPSLSAAASTGAGPSSASAASATTSAARMFASQRRFSARAIRVARVR